MPSPLALVLALKSFDPVAFLTMSMTRGMSKGSSKTRSLDTCVRIFVVEGENVKIAVSI